MQWSKYQQAIFEAFTSGSDSLLIEAVAGGGKTRTLEELARIMGERMPGQRGVMVAFNKSIAQELQARIDKAGARNVTAMTLHSAGWTAWRRAGGLDWSPEVDGLKTVKIMRDSEVLSYEEHKRFGETTKRLVAAAKGVGLVPCGECLGITTEPLYQGLVDDTDETWESLMEHYGLDEDECNVECVRKVLARGIEIARESCDFDDMLYMPVIAGVEFNKYDVVFVDEAQDVSGIQMEMISRMVGTHSLGGGRVIAVGDRNQAIYGFRGAGTTSMDEMRERFAMRELPLSVTYRCPVAVVEHAKRWVPQIEARDAVCSCGHNRGQHSAAGNCLDHIPYGLSATTGCPCKWYREDDPGAPWGFVGEEGTDWAGQAEVALGAPHCICASYYDKESAVIDELCPIHGAEEHRRRGQIEGISKWRGLSDFRPGDAILCRLTRPLVAAAFTLIRNRVAGVYVLGRDIGKGLTGLVTKSKKMRDASLGEFSRWLDDYEHREGTRLRNRGKNAQAGNLGDRCDTLRVFIEELGEDARVSELIAEVERLFVDGAEADRGRVISLATIHKAKGLEWERVFVLDASEWMPCPWARAGWEMQQEKNLSYVAATRAKRELRYITSRDLRVSGR